MSVIYLRNPEGGEKVAISEEEAKYDEGLGWVRFTPEAAAPAADEEDAPAPTRRRRAAPEE